jgi:hypothetical protein
MLPASVIPAADNIVGYRVSAWQGLMNTDNRRTNNLYRQGRREGVAAYLAWRAGRTPMPMASTLAATQPGCSVECPCEDTQAGFTDGFVWAEDNRFGGLV